MSTIACNLFFFSPGVFAELAAILLSLGRNANTRHVGAFLTLSSH
jgi:hypothetical protein